MDYLALYIPKREFKVPVVGRRLQLIQKQKSIQGDHLPVMNYKPYGHTTDDRPPGVGNELPRSNVKIGENMVYEKVNRKP